MTAAAQIGAEHVSYDVRARPVGDGGVDRTEVLLDMHGHPVPDLRLAGIGAEVHGYAVVPGGRDRDQRDPRARGLQRGGDRTGNRFGTGDDDHPAAQFPHVHSLARSSYRS